ncbi:MAG: hypothetical protein IT198_01340 [Acidimicrobiia bacterium]|nr:hypothetical protein [Acidimicrobiia bacterium]
MRTRLRHTLLVLLLAGLAVACKGQVNMDPGGPSFLSFPWPNDTRVNPDGSLDLSGHPGAWHSLLSDIVSTGAAGTRGFGSSAGVFFSVTAPVAAWSIPSMDDSTADGSSVMLVDIDAASPDYGRRVPVETEYEAFPGLYGVPNTLSIVPAFGVPLREGTTHAAILFSGLRDTTGQPLQRSTLIPKLESPWAPSTGVDEATFMALQTQWEAVKTYVEAETEWAAADVVGFTVYTTQSVTPKMEAIAASMTALPDPEPSGIEVVRACASPEDTAVVHGKIGLPVWMTGVSPYIDQGGDVVVGPDGRAVVQGTETISFEAAFPCRAAPPDGWPALVTVNGTGADFKRAGRLVDEVWGAVPTGYAVFSIAPTLSGDRLPPELLAEAKAQLTRLGYGAIADYVLGQDGVLYFNFFNGVAGKNNQRQQAADIIWASRLARAFEMSGTPVGAASDLSTDDATLGYFGHSQGAVPAPIAFAVDGTFDAALLSAPGAGFIHSILHRRDIRQLVNAILLFGGGELDDHHILAHIVQTLSEEGDPTVYATDMKVPNIVMTEGILDGCSIREAAEQLAGAARFPVAEPVLRPPFVIDEILGLPHVTLPAAGNTAEGTRLLLQLDAQHFGVQANPQLVRTFFDTLLEDGVPTVPAGPFAPERNTGQCLRWD